MPDPLKGVRVNGVNSHFDHEYLENNPIPAYEGVNCGDVLAVCDDNAGHYILGWEHIEGLDVLRNASLAGDDMVLATNSTGGVEWTRIGSVTIPTYDSVYIGSALAVTYDPDTDEKYIDWIEIIPACDCGNWGSVLVSEEDGPEWSSIDSVLNINDASDGDVLTVVRGELGGREYSYLTWGQGGEGGGSSLPMPTSDTHDSPWVLGINDDTDMPEWTTIGDMLEYGIEVNGSELVRDIEAGSSALVMTYVGGDMAWAPLWGSNFENFRLLPTDASDIPDYGMVLVNHGNRIEWEDMGGVLPPYDEYDAGKVLTVLNDGTLGWV